MINNDYITKENIEKHSPNWPEILSNSHRTLIFGGSGCGKNKQTNKQLT